MIGEGYWLNPANRNWVLVSRHELTMCDEARMNELGLDPRIIEAAQRISPYSPEGEDQLRRLGIKSGLIRVRDHGNYISVQFDAPATAEASLLRFVFEFFEATILWRPYIRVGNLRTNVETTYSWQEAFDQVVPPPQAAAE